MIANHEQVLVRKILKARSASGDVAEILAPRLQGRTMHDHVEKPLRQQLEAYKATVAERSSAYEKTLIDRSKVIRQTEKESLQTGRRRQRGERDVTAPIMCAGSVSLSSFLTR